MIIAIIHIVGISKGVRTKEMEECKEIKSK